MRKKVGGGKFWAFPERLKDLIRREALRTRNCDCAVLKPPMCVEAGLNPRAQDCFFAPAQQQLHSVYGGVSVSLN